MYWNDDHLYQAKINDYVYCTLYSVEQINYKFMITYSTHRMCVHDSTTGLKYSKKKKKRKKCIL